MLINLKAQQFKSSTTPEDTNSQTHQLINQPTHKIKTSLTQMLINLKAQQFKSSTTPEDTNSQTHQLINQPTHKIKTSPTQMLINSLTHKLKKSSTQNLKLLFLFYNSTQIFAPF